MTENTNANDKYITKLLEIYASFQQTKIQDLPTRQNNLLNIIVTTDHENEDNKLNIAPSHATNTASQENVAYIQKQLGKIVQRNIKTFNKNKTDV
jgi:hypothetical protein